MTDPTNPVSPARTIDRRTVLKAGAWSAPAIIAATAVPMAAASTTGFDLRFAAPQFGESDPWALTPDQTERYQAASPAAIVIQNAGPDPLTLDTPLTFSLRFDNLLWDVSTVRIWFLSGDDMTLTGAPTVSGRTTTLSFTTNVTIPVGTAIGDGLFIQANATYKPDSWGTPDPSFDWPAYDPAASPQWLLVSPGTDARTYQNSRTYPNVTLSLQGIEVAQAPAQLVYPTGVEFSPAVPNGVRVVAPAGQTYPAGAGFTLGVQVDSRVWDITEIRVDGVARTFTSTPSGTRTLYDVPLDIAVPAGGVVVETVREFVATPGATIDPAAEPVFWTLRDPDSASHIVDNDPRYIPPPVEPDPEP